MELVQLAYFRVVARHEHMTRAAEELNISQPSLSKAIIRLERELGVPLFDRPGRGIRLNAFGAAFFVHVERVFRELDTATDEIQSLAGLDQGVVSLAAGALHWLPQVLHPFQAAHRAVRFRLFTRTLPELHRLLETGECDLCIVPADPALPNVRWQPLRTEEVFLVVPAGHRLVGRRGVTLREVAGEDMVLGRPGDALREVMADAFRQAGFTPRVACEADEPATIQSFVATGLGVAFIPDLPGPVRDATTSWIRITEPVCTFTLGIAWNETHRSSRAARAFRDFVVARAEAGSLIMPTG